MTYVLRVLFLYFFPNKLIFDPHAGVKSKISTGGLNIFLLENTYTYTLYMEPKRKIISIFSRRTFASTIVFCFRKSASSCIFTKAGESLAAGLGFYSAASSIPATAM